MDIIVHSKCSNIFTILSSDILKCCQYWKWVGVKFNYTREIYYTDWIGRNSDLMWLINLFTFFEIENPKKRRWMSSMAEMGRVNCWFNRIVIIWTFCAMKLVAYYRYCIWCALCAFPSHHPNGFRWITVN